MYSGINAATLAKLIAGKAVSAKVLVSTGVLLGSAASGYALVTVIPDDFRDNSSDLIQRVISIEGPGQDVNSPEWRAKEIAQLSAGAFDASIQSYRKEAGIDMQINYGAMQADGASVPQLVIRHRRMDYVDKFSYDMSAFADAGVLH